MFFLTKSELWMSAVVTALVLARPQSRTEWEMRDLISYNAAPAVSSSGHTGHHPSAPLAALACLLALNLAKCSSITTHTAQTLHHIKQVGMCWPRRQRGNYSMVARQLLTKNPEEVHTYLLSCSLARLYPFKKMVFYDINVMQNYLQKTFTPYCMIPKIL